MKTKLSLLLGMTLAGTALADNHSVHFSGEVAATYSNTETYASNGADATKMNDIKAYWVQLDAVAKSEGNTSANISLLFEEGDDGAGQLNVDQAYLEKQSGDITIKMGKMRLPLGDQGTKFISDSNILTLAENNDSALLVSWAKNGLEVGGYLYNGNADANYNGSEYVQEYAIFASWSNDMMNIHFGQTSNFAEGDNVKTSAISPWKDAHATAMVLSVNAMFGKADVSFDYFSTSAFDETELTHDGDAATVTAMNLELGYKICNTWSLAFGHQSTANAGALGLYETRMLAGFGYNVDKTSAISFEYSQDAAYAEDLASGAGTGETDTGMHLKWAAKF